MKNKKIDEGIVKQKRSNKITETKYPVKEVK